MVFWTRGTASLPLILLLVLYPKPTSPLSVDGRKSSQKSTSHRPKTRIPPALLHDDRLPSRRKVLKHAVSIVGALSSSLLWNYPGWAADPLTLGEVEGLGARAERALRGKPPKALRPPLDQDFAVLLMRSSYMALDAIDCVAMDQFQRDFFLLRQSEYQPYIDQVGPGIVQQGFLTDPYYFDFISFAQYATISREINQNPPSVFVERQPSPTDDTDDSPTEFIDVVVKRNPTLTNDRLAPQHSRLVGGAILDKLIENVGSTDIAIPAIKPGDNGSVLAALTQLAKLFAVNGFAWNGRAEEDGTGTSTYCLTLDTPANLWSGRALQSRKDSPVNCFLLKAAIELVTRAGYQVVSSSVRYEGLVEKSFLTIQYSDAMVSV